MSDFQEELHSEGYDKVIIIGVGKDFLQDSFGETFCENSVLPLVLDTSEDFINFDIRGQFEASHKEIVIIGSDGNLLDRIVMDFDDITPYLEQMYDIIIQNYDSGDNWTLWDTARDLYNGGDYSNWTSEGDTTSLEWSDSNFYHDKLSNGFKLRASHIQINQANTDYLYLAFAKSPFKTSNAR